MSKLLADTYTLYLKTHNFHWNVTGPMFNALHIMFMVQYNELWLSLDEIAERIRALDEFAPGSGAQYAKLSSIDEETGVPDWKGMVGQLVGGHETCAAPRARCSSAPSGQRPADRRPGDHAHAGAREDGLDAALVAPIGSLRGFALNR